MIQVLKQKKILALVASMGLAGAVAFAPTAASAGYLTYGDSQGVVNGYQECWQAEGGMASPTGPKECVDCSKLDSDGDGVNDCNDKCPNTPKGARVNADGCEIIADVTLSTEVLFDFDKSNLKPSGKDALNELAGKIKATEGVETISIVGHTDPIGKDAYNQKLSERRARAVADYMGGAGVPSASVTGMGERELVVTGCGSDKKCNAPNRRVEVKAQ